MADDQRDDDIEAEAAESAVTEEAPQYGVGPFTIRELSLLGVWVVAFVVSFFSITTDRRFFPILDEGAESVWTMGIEWILAIGLPTVAVFLIILRRFSPDGIRRVGSLAVDQFASVTFSVATVVWATWLWKNIGTAIAHDGVWVYSWVVWVEFFLMLAGVVLTVVAPFIPTLQQDFRDRPEVVAHRNARPVRPVTKRPAPAPRPAPEDDDMQQALALAPVAERDAYSAPDRTVDEPTLVDEPLAAEADAWAPTQARDTFEPVEPEPAPARQQAFWALAPDERDVVDESGIPLFRIGPTAWALVIEDRGDAYIVRHEDGRVGYLNDISGVTRG